MMGAYKRLVQMRMIVVLCALAACALEPAIAATPINIVVGPDAPPLERMAAEELANQFQRLFADVEPAVDTKLPQSDANKGPLILVGNPDTNPAIRQLVGDWPKLSDQGIVLRSFASEGQQGIAIGGGSPVATLWAAYELGHRFGIRYLLHGDIDPKDKVEPKFDGLDVVMEPTLKTRAWRTINDFAIGPESWGLADHKTLLKQLAKLKFNQVMLSLYPWQPFVHYEYGGVKKQTAMLWFGEKFRIDGDTPGRAAFGAGRFFENPDFAGLSSYEEMTAAGRKHMQGIIDAGRGLGMSVGISISPLEFPREFAAALPGAQVAKGLKDLTVIPGPAHRPDDPQLLALVTAKIRGYLDTYSGIDALYLTLPEFPEWEAQADVAWRQLAKGHDLSGHSLDEVVAAGQQRNLVASGGRGAQSVRGNVVALAFLENLLADEDLLVGKDGRKIEPIITAIDPALFDILDRVLPQRTGAMHFVDYTAKRVVENREMLARVPAKKVPSSLILTLADDNVGILPQSAARKIDVIVGDLRKLGWDGFSTRYWMLSEMDPTVHYLSRAAFDPNVTARSAHDDLFATITGNKPATDRLWLAFGHIESATELIDQNDLGFAFPVEGMMTKHYQPEPMPAWFDKVMAEYVESSNELYRSHDAIDLRARKTVYYYAKRSEYVLDYLNAVKEVRLAAIAEKAGKKDEAAAHLETAVESLYNAIDTLGDIAGDQSDRGLIAVLTEHAYRPIKAKHERTLEDLESK